jgi:hypothetical protein
MTQNEAIQKAHLFATGKATMPTEGSTKYVKILALLNAYKDIWATEPGVDWASLRSYATLSAVVTATATFALPATIGKVSKRQGDTVIVTAIDGTETEYNLVPAYELNDPGNESACAIIGSNLVFATAFTASSPQLGGAITVPRHSTPADMASASTVVPVDDPYYIVFMAAADFVRNDVTKQDQYGNLVGQAAERMTYMKQNNQSQDETIPNYAVATAGETW